MKYKKIVDYFDESGLHKFKVSKEGSNFLSKVEKEILTKIGVPFKITNVQFNYYPEVIFDAFDNSFRLGGMKGLAYFHLKISIKDKSIFNFWNNPKGKSVKTFYNSSLEQLLLCVYESEKFWKEIKMPEKLGNRYKKHEVYGEYLRNKIAAIDPKAAKSGAWGGYIQEISWGVIF